MGIPIAESVFYKRGLVGVDGRIVMVDQTTGEEQFGLGELPIDVTNWVYSPGQAQKGEEPIQKDSELQRQDRLVRDSTSD